MDEFDSFDPALFGTWREHAAYGDEIVMEDVALAGEVRAALETKSADSAISPANELRRLLNEMTVEMREQFATFRAMRQSAAAALTDGDDAAQKLARADVKAATDAMSLIVRTLEKVDTLQRQLARDREIEAERVADESGYEEAKARFIRMIEDKANDRAVQMFEAWKRTGPPDEIARRLEGEAAKPADEATGDGKDREGCELGFHRIGSGHSGHFGGT